jgi:hypothetical protein
MELNRIEQQQRRRIHIYLPTPPSAVPFVYLSLRRALQKLTAPTPQHQPWVVCQRQTSPQTNYVIPQNIT